MPERPLTSPLQTQEDGDSTQSYWTSFYAHNDPVGASSFCDGTNARTDLPSAVIDIGCGNGRDSCAFAVAGRQVQGLDFSQTAVEHARQRAAELGVSDRVRFDTADVSDSRALDERLAKLRQRASDGAVLFYMRFFLHAIPEDVQDTLMTAIARLSRPGDFFAAEFRTTGDEARAKIHSDHYRRYQDGPAFGRKLREDFGFVVLDELESDGLSPYRDEDPMLYRVYARKDASGQP